MALFDPYQWYQISIPLLPRQSLAGLAPGTNTSSDPTVLFQPSNSSAESQRWQIFPTDATTYVLRSRASGMDGYLAIRDIATNNNNNNNNAPSPSPPKNPPLANSNANMKTTALMSNTQGAGMEIYWRIVQLNNTGTATGTGFYTLGNVANGTGWRLRAENGGSALLMWSSGDGGDQVKDDAKFGFTGVGKIEEGGWDRAKLPSGTSVPAFSTSPSTSGLSTRNKAAIGASVSGFGILAIAFALFFLFRRRRNQQQQQLQQEHAQAHALHNPARDSVQDQSPYEKAELEAGGVVAPNTAAGAAGVEKDGGLREDNERYAQEMDSAQVPSSPVELPGAPAKAVGENVEENEKKKGE